MVSSFSLDEYVGGIVRRYSSLFTLPSQERIVLSLFAFCAVGGVLAILPSWASYDGFVLGLIFGISFFLIVVSSDFVIRLFFMEDDPIYTFRRCSALSLFSSLIWLGLVFLGSIISVLLENPDVWIKVFLLGFCAAVMLRLIVFSTTSFASTGRIFLSSVLHPTLCVILLFLMAPTIGLTLGVPLILFIPFSISVVGLTALLFTFFVDRAGEKAVGIPSLSLFRAFMANWTEDLNAPLESLFDRVGRKRDVGFSLLAFRKRRGMKAVMVVPAFHPGPFRNVGSSLFPSMVQDALESKMRCVVSVPHGLFGHGLDLSSQVESRRVVDAVLGSVDFLSFEPEATPFVRVRRNGASASCQLFGDCAFLTLTLAPETMEDLPEELNSVVLSEAKERGLLLAIPVDAHNSIDGPFDPERVVGPLRMAAVAGLEEALNHQRCPFKLGASRIVPEELGIKDGMGPGGISAIVTEVVGQKAAYVTIDGNNMVSGLREEILSMLRELGITDGEVLTTDTHAVTGVVLTPRGYHPVGEVMNQSKLIEYVRKATTEALNNLESVEVSSCARTVPDVKVIGEEQIKTLCVLVEKAARLAKKLAAILFPMAGISLTILMAFL